MAKKRTLICIHVMPSEMEMFERLMIQFHKALSYLDDNDDVTLKVTLNLNPELTDWNSSEFKQDYFISRFEVLFNGIKNIPFIIQQTDQLGSFEWDIFQIHIFNLNKKDMVYPFFKNVF